MSGLVHETARAMNTVILPAGRCYGLWCWFRDGTVGFEMVNALE